MWGCLEQRPRSRHLPAGLHHTQEPSQPHVPWGEATRPRTWGKRVPEGRVTALQSALPAGRGARGLVRHIDPALPDARCLGTSSPAHGLSPTASGLRCRFCTNRTRRPLGLFQAAGRTAGRGPQQVPGPSSVGFPPGGTPSQASGRLPGWGDTGPSSTRAVPHGTRKSCPEDSDAHCYPELLILRVQSELGQSLSRKFSSSTLLVRRAVVHGLSETW